MREIKKLLSPSAVLAALLLSAAGAAEERQTLRIAGVEYETDGKTSEHALAKKARIDTDRTFSSVEELEDYLEVIRRRIESLRAFDTVALDYEEAPADERGSESDVFVRIYTEDSRHFVLLPYPKYSSSDGFGVKLKLKDTNFMGTLEDFSAEVSYGAKTNPDGSFDRNELGAAVSHNHPFRLAALDALWLNDHAVTYSPGDESPAWKLRTGISLAYPLGRLALVNEFDQTFARYIDEDIEDHDGRTVLVENETFFVERDRLSLPVTLARTKRLGDVRVSPFVDFSFAWSPFSSGHEELLLKKELFGGVDISFGRVDWVKNLRTGLSVRLGAKIGRDFTNRNAVREAKAEVRGFKAFIFEFDDGRSFEFALNFDALAFCASNTTECFGERLRGVYDKPYFATRGFTDRKSTVSSDGVIVSVDAPFKITRIHWGDLPSFQNVSWLRHLDMEIQAGPFASLALFDNRAAGTTMELQDGFFTMGGEVIVYPLRWKGIQLRASFGYDLSRVIPFFNKEWRSGEYPKHEISIGFGLHY